MDNPPRDGEPPGIPPEDGEASPPNQFLDAEYWDALIPEEPAGAFLGVTPRTMQKMRQRGDGPPYIVLSSRCLRYTRRRLKKYADARLRTSTSDPGAEAT